LKNVLNQTPKKSKPLSCLLVDGIECTDPLKMAKALNKFFTNAASLIVDQIPTTDRPPDPAAEPELHHPLFSFVNAPVTRSEIADVIKLLKEKKTQDYCGISVNFLKSISDQLQIPLQHIINLSLETSIVPSQMKIAKVIPLFKNGDPLSMDNYRPISLLSSFSKILEKIVANRLCSYLESYNLLSRSQFGFRTGHSTIHPMIHSTNHVAKALTIKNTLLPFFVIFARLLIHAIIKFFCLNSPGSVLGALPLNGLLITFRTENNSSVSMVLTVLCRPSSWVCPRARYWAPFFFFCT
jgi:hypothetical protein